MNNDLHCPVIHGGLVIDLKKSNNGTVAIGNCCLRDTVEVEPVDLWRNPTLIPIRQLNNTNVWADRCGCQNIENTGQESFRTGALKMFGKETDLVGPQRLDLMFDIGCNLACRTCGPRSSTFWQKHLTTNNIPFSTLITPESKVDEMISILKTLNLSRLESVVFCGGETLMGNGFWRVADAISKLADPQKITLSFQTNGTQSIDKKHYKLIEKFHLMKLNISLDGAEEQFEYLRWPASWDQVTNNIFELKQQLPVNTMFLIEETISIFNLHYQDRLQHWLEKNYSVNRLGDKIDHTRHLANGMFSIDNLTEEYIESLPNTAKKIISPSWQENSANIQHMLAQIQKFDSVRKQDWTKTFPEVAAFYKKFNFTST